MTEPKIKSRAGSQRVGEFRNSRLLKKDNRVIGD